MSGWLTEGAANAEAFAGLRGAIAEHGTLALIGAGSSARVGYPLWGGLLDRMAQTITKISPLAKPSVDALAAEADALWRAEEYRRLLGDDGYATFIRTTFGPEEAPCDDFHKDLVSLPFRHVLTTNYDAVLEQAHSAAFPGQRAVAMSWSEPHNVRELIHRIGDSAFGRRYVYLHGRFDDPGTIVLTERDYGERYVKQRDTWPKLFSLLATPRLVSIGFSLSDLDVMSVFRSVKELMGVGDPRHFAILPLDGADTGVARQRLRGKYGIEPVFYRQTPRHEGLHEVVRALREALEPPKAPAPTPSQATAETAPAQTASSQAPAADDPLPPRTGYDPACYARRELVERQILGGLSQAGTPVVVLGPSRFGKTALLRYVLSAALDADKTASKQSHAVLVELAALGPEALATFDDFAYELAVRIVEGVDGEDAWVEEAWKRPGGAASRLTWLLRRRVLNTVTGRLVLAIESSDDVPHFNFWESVLGLLRSWVQLFEAPWDRLRVALAVSTMPTLFKSEISQSSFFNAAMLIRLDDLGPAQIAQIAKLYRPGWTEPEITPLVDVIGGHPYLVRLAMYHAALHGWKVSDLLADVEKPGGGLYYDFLRSIEERLGDDLSTVICDVIAKPSARLDADTEDRLRGAGLIRWVDGEDGKGGKYRFRYPLYERYFRGECERRK